MSTCNCLMNTEKLTERQIAYREYLKSDHWLDLRQRAFAKLGRRCSICKHRKRIQVHHKFYREVWTETQVDDLQVLCDACHGLKHGIRPANLPVRLVRKLEKMLRRENRPVQQKQQPHRKSKKHRRGNRPMRWWPGMYEGKRPGEIQ